MFYLQRFPYIPTLEEFEHLVGITTENKLSFLDIEDFPKNEVVFVAIHINKKEINPNLEVKGNTQGFSLKFLVEKDFTFIDTQNW